jgi:hypothetical protein
MTAKEVMQVVVGTILVLVLLAAGLFGLLTYSDHLFKKDTKNADHVDCTEEDMRGLCGIKARIEQERSTSGIIEI